MISTTLPIVHGKQLFNGDWEDVQVSLRLKSPDEVPPKRYSLPELPIEPEFILVDDRANYERQKAKKKAKRKQQAEARRKNRKKN